MVRRLIWLVVLVVFLVGGYVAYTSVTLPNVRQALDEGIEPAPSSQILAADQTVLMSYGRFHHKPVPISKVNPVMIDALLSTEDRRFYNHFGIDPLGIARAVVRNVTSKGFHEGASTLTQQLARNIFLTNERSAERKVKEALLALKIEHQLTKKEILELYLNNVYFGEGAYGIAAASQLYFGKPPSKLTIEEAALLAGMPQAPSMYSPFSSKEKALKRRNEVLDNMVENGKLDAEKAEVLKKRPIHVNEASYAAANRTLGPFFNRYVINQVCSLLDIDEQTFWQRGMKVYTTLDPHAQKLAESTVINLSNSFGRTGLKQQAALFSLDNSGRIIAYVGGKDFAKSQFDRVTQAHRQAGSLFKVFVYTTAFEQNFAPTTVYNDAEVTFDAYDGWRPENYDKKHHGPMSLAKALALSNNVIAAKLMNDVGPENVVRTAQRMGIESSLHPNLSLALGSSDVTLKEMTTAFSVFSNDGVWMQPHAIEKIVDHDGSMIYEYQPQSKEVLKRVARDTMVRMMQGVIRFGTGKGAAIGHPCAGKTGTSDNYHDAWFIGYTADVTTGVWVGNDDNSQMAGVSGGSLPASIWKTYMSGLLATEPKKGFDTESSLPFTDADFSTYNKDNLAESEKDAVIPDSADPDADSNALDDSGDPEAAPSPSTSPDGPGPLRPYSGDDPAMDMPTDADMTDARPQPTPKAPVSPSAPVAPTGQRTSRMPVTQPVSASQAIHESYDSGTGTRATRRSSTLKSPVLNEP